MPPINNEVVECRYTISSSPVSMFTVIKLKQLKCVLKRTSAKQRRGLLKTASSEEVNPLNTELNPICYLLALLRAHHFLHVSRIRVNNE